MGIILLSGPQASGKTTFAQRYIDQGYIHLNRDKLGGKLSKLHRLLKEELHKNNNVILDNTSPTKESRKPFLEIAKSFNVQIDCLSFHDITIEEVLFNASRRIIQRYNRCLSPQEIKASKDPNIFPPGVLYGYFKARELPELSEGFNSIDIIKFERNVGKEYCNKALFCDFDGTLRRTISGQLYPTSPTDIKILPGRVEKLQRYACDYGYKLIGVSNQSGISKGILTEQMAENCFEETINQLNVEMDYWYCPHQSYPIICYCRKPMPGMALFFMEKYKLNLSECLMIGDLESDKEFAKNCGMEFQWAEQFFLN